MIPGGKFTVRIDNNYDDTSKTSRIQQRTSHQRKRAQAGPSLVPRCVGVLVEGLPGSEEPGARPTGQPPVGGEFMQREPMNSMKVSVAIHDVT